MKSRLLAVLLAASLVPAALAADPTLEARKIYLRARSALGDGRYREALDLYRRVIEQLPEDAVVRFEYAQLLRDLNVADEAAKQAREAVRLDPSFSEARRLLGSIELSGAGSDPARLDKAIEELRQAHKLAPDDAATTASLARALLARGRSGEAAALLDEIPEGRSQPGLMRLTAEARAKSGRFREAEAVYRELLELDPGDRESQAALVDLYEDQDRLDDALALLQEMEKRDPENAAIGERITLDFARAGRFGEAEKRARDQASRRPENRSIRRLLASVLFEKADVIGGEKILRDLLKADPDDEAARRALAGELLRERRFGEARPLLEESLRRAGTDPKNAAERQWAQVELAYLLLSAEGLRGSQEGARLRGCFGLGGQSPCHAYPSPDRSGYRGLRLRPGSGQGCGGRGQRERRMARRGRRVPVPVRGPPAGGGSPRPSGGLEGSGAGSRRRGRLRTLEGIRLGRPCGARHCQAVPREPGRSLPPGFKPRARGKFRGSGEDLFQAPGNEAQRLRRSELPRLHVG